MSIDVVYHGSPVHSDRLQGPFKKANVKAADPLTVQAAIGIIGAKDPTRAHDVNLGKRVRRCVCVRACVFPLLRCWVQPARFGAAVRDVTFRCAAVVARVRAELVAKTPSQRMAHTPPTRIPNLMTAKLGKGRHKWNRYDLRVKILGCELRCSAIWN